MNSTEGQRMIDVSVDTNNLYREESFTDLKVASIRRLTPVKSDGSPDNTRTPIFMGQTQVMSSMGPLPVQCKMEAKTLEEAIRKFPQALEQAVQQMMEEAKEMRRQESSRIVVPTTQPSGGIMPPGGGGRPGGGGIIRG